MAQAKFQLEEIAAAFNFQVQTWLSAAPLVGIHPEDFCNLGCIQPAVTVELHGPTFEVESNDVVHCTPPVLDG